MTNNKKLVKYSLRKSAAAETTRVATAAAFGIKFVEKAPKELSAMEMAFRKAVEK